MTDRDTRRNAVHVRLLDDVDAPHIGVRQSWLAMAIWDGVRVMVKSRRGLTLMEQFVIECLLGLGACSSADLGEIADIPEELADWHLAILAERRLAQRQGDAVFVPAATACAEALASKSVPVEREEMRTFLWFPETEEFIALQERGDVARKLRRTVPMGSYPLAERHKRARRADLLRAAMESHRLHGDDSDAICRIVDDEIVTDDICPAYHGAAALPDPEACEWRLTLTGKKRRNQSGKIGNDNGQDEARPETVDHVLCLPILRSLVQQWRAHLEHAQVEVRTCLADRGFRSIEMKGDVFHTTVDAEMATKMADKQLLAASVGLSVQVEREIEFEVPMKLSPQDDVARQMFALDRKVRELMAATDASEAMRTVSGADIALRDAICARMWHLKLFGKIYELRQAEDFRV